MRGLIVGKIALLVGMLGVSGTATAQGAESGTFTSERQAENYLRQNPNGPLAKAAFLAIVEFQLARENPGFSRSDIAKGIALNAPVTADGVAPAATNDRNGGDIY